MGVQIENISNPDASQEAHEVVFSRKNYSNHSYTYFNNMPSIMKNTKKNLGLYLDAKLLAFIKSSEKSIYNIYYSQGSELLDRLR